MAKKLRYGVIGCGAIAKGKYLPSIQRLGDVDITAFCDTLPVNAEKVNREYADGKGKVFNDYRELLREELDAVLVLTPNNSHSEITVAALKSGKHVMCEKPMAKSYAEAKAMIDARNKSKKLLTANLQPVRLCSVTSRVFPNQICCFHVFLRSVFEIDKTERRRRGTAA